MTSIDIQNYTGTTEPTHYFWSGLNTLNQMWSRIDVPNPMIASQLKINACAYSGTTTLYACLWDASGTLLVESGGMSVGSTPTWLTAGINPIYLAAGVYYIGFWGDPSTNRQANQWATSTADTNLYTHTYTSGASSMTNAGSTSNSGYANGVLAGHILGDPAGVMWINQLGTWHHGTVWINQLGTWKQAQRVWINQLGTWKPST